MCGRFAFVPRNHSLVYQFGLDEPIDYTPRYNSAPGTEILFLCSTDEQVSPLMRRWGLIPFFVRDLKKAHPILNVRAETVFEKPAYRH